MKLNFYMLLGLLLTTQTIVTYDLADPTVTNIYDVYMGALKATNAGLTRTYMGEFVTKPNTKTTIEAIGAKVKTALEALKGGEDPTKTTALENEVAKLKAAAATHAAKLKAETDKIKPLEAENKRLEALIKKQLLELKNADTENSKLTLEIAGLKATAAINVTKLQNFQALEAENKKLKKEAATHAAQLKAATDALKADLRGKVQTIDTQIKGLDTDIKNKIKTL